MHSASRVRSRSSRVSVAVSGMVSSFIRVRPYAGPPGPNRGGSCLQVAVHEVDLLQPAKALADVLRADLPDALDRFQLRIGGGEDLVQPAKFANDVLHHQLGKPGDAAEDAESAGRDGKVERVDLAVVAEQLGEATEVEQVLVRQARDAVERQGEGVVDRIGEVVVQQGGLVARDADHRLLE